MYGEQGKFADAIVLLEHASAKANANPRIWYNLGLLYQKTGQNVKSEAALNQGLRSDPCNFDLLYALFVFHMNQHNREKATPLIEKLKSCYPDAKQVKDIYDDFVRRGMATR